MRRSGRPCTQRRVSRAARWTPAVRRAPPGMPAPSRRSHRPSTPSGQHRHPADAAPGAGGHHERPRWALVISGRSSAYRGPCQDRDAGRPGYRTSGPRPDGRGLVVDRRLSQGDRRRAAGQPLRWNVPRRRLSGLGTAWARSRGTDEGRAVGSVLQACRSRRHTGQVRLRAPSRRRSLLATAPRESLKSERDRNSLSSRLSGRRCLGCPTVQGGWRYGRARKVWQATRCVRPRPSP